MFNSIEKVLSSRFKSEGDLNMWMPAIIATIVALTTIIFLTNLEKREKLKRGTKLYKIIEIVGLYIPILIICVNYAYMKTDTLTENIIVLSGICICIGLIGLFGKIGRTSKYNYIFFPIVILVCYFICNYITAYMLSNFDKSIFTGAISGVSASLIFSSKKKVKLIISSILIFTVIVTAPINYLKNFEIRNKVERIAMEYVENLGHDVIDKDEIIMFSNGNRYEKIKFSIIRRKLDDEWKLSRYFWMVYYNGRIIEFREE